MKRMQAALRRCFCTAAHRFAQQICGRPLANFFRQGYSHPRLSRSASKTNQHNQKRAPEPQGSCALNFFALAPAPDSPSRVRLIQHCGRNPKPSQSLSLLLSATRITCSCGLPAVGRLYAAAGGQGATLCCASFSSSLSCWSCSCSMPPPNPAPCASSAAPPSMLRPTKFSRLSMTSTIGANGRRRINKTKL
jgi:hypothetical protein